ncbi:hypothetical protein VFPPC_10490 [Pochonia chlamydosporia 170]|uniref:Uncharacterized protein n=1 Tax=Pochonia chlamydosporia 170 TaxID=1380566 RepID=A0A179F1X7_METCM|nr:hypothetical protein VFPPC_10490 [Pochonia chlamydosporia 170]OAQ59432.2 hypothetical protein VFPPC_10490 [Pochonia chlamydosporia 170]
MAGKEQQHTKLPGDRRRIRGVVVSAIVFMTILMFTPNSLNPLCGRRRNTFFGRCRGSYDEPNNNSLDPATTSHACGTVSEASRVLLVIGNRGFGTDSDDNVQIMPICIPKSSPSYGVSSVISHIGQIIEIDGQIPPTIPSFCHQRCLAKSGKCSCHEVADDSWTDNRYHNLVTAKRAFDVRPDDDWYLFIDHNTCVLYSRVRKWLWRLDPGEPHYVGRPGIFPFAQGRSGYLVSRSAMQEMFSETLPSPDQYSLRIPALEVTLSSEALTRKHPALSLSANTLLC